MIVTAEQDRTGFFRRTFKATIRADVNDLADIDDDWPEIVRWLRQWTKDRDENAVELNIIIHADREYRSKFNRVVESDLPPSESEFFSLVRNMEVRLTVFDHDGDWSLDWTHPDCNG